MQKISAIIGGGVIGGGWAARFLLNGWDVRLFDPDREATRKVKEILDNARRSLPGLANVALPEEGRLTFCNSIAEAVDGAEWIQESVPERLDLKRRVYADIQETAGRGAVLASSASGFKPSDLQAGAIFTDQILVCHPFNPVYLLPLVEVVPGKATDPAIVQKTIRILKNLGMKPLQVRKEIDAHIADRLLEAVWRESLWLVNDGIATTEEIDDAIRYGFGLRWAQMGLFETYRIAGGEAGMTHFLAQFGPALAWPWTRLMDVPELTDALVGRIAAQSDAQSGRYSIRELEQIRDNNLVTIMRGLKSRNWGAGALLNAHDAALAAPNTEEIDLSKPIRTQTRAVPLNWTDYNGHMNETRYLQVFSEATDRFMEIIGCDAAYIATGGSYFTAETHIRHLNEASAGMRIYVETCCLSGEGRKMHIFNTLYRNDGERLATGEHLLIHVDLATRRSSPPSPAIARKLSMIATHHARLPRPEGVGRYVGQPRP
ncbi:MAG: carnitine 3-dehydrogenase [Deltaproteobacteria bacterium]|nr:MAG: carnitine 3-dehydrogenase [Deltaproteobacteria bacterium]